MKLWWVQPTLREFASGNMPHETVFVDVAGKKTQLTKGGSGPPLVYLHGASGETDWLPLHAGLARHFTVFAPAHPGFALSAGLDQIRDMNDLAWHYVDLFEALKLTGVPVVGFSLGAWLGVELALLRPHLVSKLVLSNAAGLHVPGAPIAELFIDNLEQLRQLLFFEPHGAAADQLIPRSVEDERILFWLRAREATARVGWNPYLHNPRLVGHLRRIDCPTLILWGRDDKLIPLAHGETYARHMDGARLEVFADCGHMLPFEKPDEFVAATTSFLRGE